MLKKRKDEHIQTFHSSVGTQLILCVYLPFPYVICVFLHICSLPWLPFGELFTLQLPLLWHPFCWTCRLLLHSPVGIPGGQAEGLKLPLHISIILLSAWSRVSLTKWPLIAGLYEGMTEWILPCFLTFPVWPNTDLQCDQLFYKKKEIIFSKNFSAFYGHFLIFLCFRL